MGAMSDWNFMSVIILVGVFMLWNWNQDWPIHSEPRLFTSAILDAAKDLL